MSLINDALVELEQRKTIGRPSSVSSEERPYQASKKVSKNRRFMLLCVLASGLLLVNGGLFLQQDDRGSVLLVSTSSEPSPVSNEIVIPVSSARVSSENQDHAQTLSHLDTMSVEIDLAQEYEVLIREGNKLLSELKLTTPEKNNAYALFRRAQILKPEGRTAQKGIERIKQRYMNLIDSAVKKHQLSTAESYWERLSAILSVEEQHKYKRRKNEIVQMYKRRSSSGTNMLSVSDEHLGVDRASGVSVGLNTSANPDSNSSPNSALNPEKNSTRGKNSDERLSRLLDRGEFSQAEALIHNELNKITRENLSEAMFTHLLDYQEFVLLGKLLQRRSNVGESWPYYRAQLKLREQGVESALSVLDAHVLKKERDVAFRAGLLNKALRHADAEKAYQWLLSKDVQRAQYWLGLAISQDAQKKLKPALDAYRMSSSLGGFEQDVEKFIASRLTTLSKTTLSKHNLSKRSGHALELSQW